MTNMFIFPNLMKKNYNISHAFNPNRGITIACYRILDFTTVAIDIDPVLLEEIYYTYWIFGQGKFFFQKNRYNIQASN
jgi:hypothetical protein